jgi:hypothetical protein
MGQPCWPDKTQFPARKTQIGTVKIFENARKTQISRKKTQINSGIFLRALGHLKPVFPGAATSPENSRFKPPTSFPDMGQNRSIP